jgi:hypothetical protein
MSDRQPYHHLCVRCGQLVSEKGRLCLDCVYVIPLAERRTIWRRTA